MIDLVKSALKLTACAGLMLSIASVPASAFDTKARAAFVLDQSTDTVLLSKNAEVPLPPASMSKLMTLYVAFEALRDGRLTLDEQLPVSEHAMSYGGSTMFLDTTDRVRVEDLLRGTIVLAVNDACAVIAALAHRCGRLDAVTMLAPISGRVVAQYVWGVAGHKAGIALLPVA